MMEDLTWEWKGLSRDSGARYKRANDLGLIGDDGCEVEKRH